MKHISLITDNDIKELYGIGKEWEVYSKKYDYGVIHIKWRKPYAEGDIKFNEDGYEYKSTFIHPSNLSVTDVLVLNNKGYSTPYNELINH